MYVYLYIFIYIYIFFLNIHRFAFKSSYTNIISKPSFWPPGKLNISVASVATPRCRTPGRRAALRRELHALGPCVAHLRVAAHGIGGEFTSESIPKSRERLN